MFFFHVFFYSNSNFSFSSTYNGLINITMLTLQNLFFDILNVKQNKSE